MVPFAANPLQPLIDFFETILVLFHDDVGFGWGLSIVVLTVLVRAALLPLTFKQFKSMQNMARFQPEIKKLQERFKGDKERLNQEMMKFYRENKVNPFASCLPLLAQLPVFLALFYMLQKDLRLDICPDINPPGTQDPRSCGAGGDAGFLFVPDLTNKATGAVLIALIVLYIGSQLASTLLMSTTTDKTQRYLFMAMPFFFTIFVINFPAGLLVYWITTNLWTVVQQLIIRKRLGPLRPPGSEPQEGLGDMIRKAMKPREPEPAAAGARRERGTRGAAGQRGGGAAAKAIDAGSSETGGRSGVAKPKTRPTGLSPDAPAAQKEAVGPQAMSTDAPTPPEEPLDPDDDTDELPPIERVRELLEVVSEALDLDADIEVEEREGQIRGVLVGEDLGLFIGRHGQTIDAVQHLAFKAAARGIADAPRVEVDAAGYRERRRVALERQADQAAAEAERTGRPVALDAMSATERKVVHEYLKDHAGVETYSEGAGNERHLVVAPLDRPD